MAFNWRREITRNAQSFESQLIALKMDSNESLDYKHSQMQVTLIFVSNFVSILSPYIKLKSFRVKPWSPFKVVVES